MVDVYFHETHCPEDRAMRKFLWESYFHDAELLRIDYGCPEWCDITLVVRDNEDTWHLRFHRVKHFDHASQAVLDFALSQRIFFTGFLDSALLHRCRKEADKPLHHLRIDLSDGLMDIVFQRFTIRREGGRVSYKPRVTQDVQYDFATGMTRLISLLDEDPELRDRESLLACDLFRAQQAGDVSAIRRIARALLQPGNIFNWADYAAYMLGHHGDVSDLPALMAVFADPECTLHLRREMQDAMERIMEREEEHP